MSLFTRVLSCLVSAEGKVQEETEGEIISDLRDAAAALHSDDGDQDRDGETDGGE